MQKEITAYYDNLAERYDEDRFGNSYGQYIDSQEKAILQNWIGNRPEGPGLDIACGTGRMASFVTHGLDISPEMIRIASGKFPAKVFKVGSATETGYDDHAFHRILSFHLVMHLDQKTTRRILEEAYRILKPGGSFILDFPSRKRRSLTGYKAATWHAANGFSLSEFEELAGKQWKIKRSAGILSFPIHRIPNGLRPTFRSLDSFLGRSFLKEYSSYLILELTRQ